MFFINLSSSSTFTPLKFSLVMPKFLETVYKIVLYEGKLCHRLRIVHDLRYRYLTKAFGIHYKVFFADCIIIISSVPSNNHPSQNRVLYQKHLRHIF